MFNLQKKKINVKTVSSANQHLSVSVKDRGINAFQIIKNVYPLPLE